ncbi:coiled-coil domain-containing protein 18-like [Leptopilina heterotoma]|uniref:coiled-coil domain-containing protein 18-like n=1 Tax=Leptopilina heterotoma TaxID=63436 RepID=UPI001CA867CF|nr:coiled-coil domain-containing protein 18-like [Leptopilina heterotoma]
MEHDGKVKKFVIKERAADMEKISRTLRGENTHLKRLTKAANDSTMIESVSDSEVPVINDKPLSEQLTSNAQTRALKFELKNRRLLMLIESLKENSFHESSSLVFELEKEKKKLLLKIESLTDNSERITQQNSDLELVCKQALEENKKLQTSSKNQKLSYEKQQQNLQAQHTKLNDMEIRRADDVECSLESPNKKLEELRKIESESNKIQTKCLELEDVALDQASYTIELLEEKVAQLEQEVVIQLLNFLVERSSKELISIAAIDRETLETLQSNLVAEKLNTQKLYTILEKFGIERNTIVKEDEVKSSTFQEEMRILKIYKDYFDLEITNQDKNFVPHKICSSCYTILTRWNHKKGDKLKFIKPTLWEKPLNQKDCYFCNTNVQGYNNKNKKNILYANVDTVKKPEFSCNPPSSPKTLEIDSSTEDVLDFENKDMRTDDEDDYYLPYDEQEIKIRQTFNQEELSNLIRDLKLPKDCAEHLASVLKKKNLLSKGTTVSFYRDREKEFRQYFTKDENPSAFNGAVVENFLGNHKSENWKQIVSDMIKNFDSHRDRFPENLGDYNEEQGERFHQDLKEFERRYQERWDVNMMSDYCWMLKRDIVPGGTNLKRKPLHRSFEDKRVRYHKRT